MSRPKITEPLEPVGELPNLTPRQQKFVTFILEGRPTKQAYIDAGFAVPERKKSAGEMAGKLFRNPKIQAWISAGKRAALGKAAWPLERYILALEAAAEEAKLSGNHGARIQALKLIGEASGHHRQAVDVTTHSDPRDALKAIAEVSPEIAAQIAKQHGIGWEH
jgi:hypothetical protein